MITNKAKFSQVLKNVYLTKKSPVSLIHFLTNRCNARCSFCFIDFDNPKTFVGELDILEIEKMTKNLGNTLLNVNFTGGEPEFVDGKMIHPKTGSVLVFPSLWTFPHAGLPVKSGTKYILTTYFHYI